MRAQLATLVVATIAALGAGATSPAQAVAAADTDCPDYAYQEDAQTAFDAHGGSSSYNWNGLDGNDHDGVVCESRPHRAAAAPAASGLRGSFDQASSTSNGTIVLGGWALDLDEPTRTIDVHVYVDGVGHVRTAFADRPDVAGVFPTAGPGHGFADEISVTTGVEHQVCAYAINVGAGAPNLPLGCRTVFVQDNGPVGTQDPLGFFPDGSPVVSGWAFDTDLLSEPIAVHAYVDGVRGYVLSTGVSRPDVTTALSLPFDNAGYVAVLPPQGPGRHQVCTYGINVGGGNNHLLGCLTYG